MARGAVGAMILAAGRSTRISGNKLAAPFGATSVVAHVADAITGAGLPPPLVVIGHQADAVRTALAGREACFVEASDYRGGLSRSIAAGVVAVPEEWAAVIICLGDMPLVTPDLLRSLAMRAASDAIVVPVHHGRRGNPVLWGRSYFDRLTGLSGDTGAKALLGEYAENVEEIAWGDGSIFLDVDTAEALAEARKMLVDRRPSSGTGDPA